MKLIQYGIDINFKVIISMSLEYDSRSGDQLHIVIPKYLGKIKFGNLFSFSFAVFIKKTMKVVVAYQNAFLPVQLP